jgi:O-antigen/teichoic acid export membrane protein
MPRGAAARFSSAAAQLTRILRGRDNASIAQRITLSAFGIRVVSAAIALFSQVVLARMMGSFEYGIFVLVWTAMIIAGNISCLGFQVSIIRFVPQYREQGDLPRLRGFLHVSRLVVFAASTLLAMAGAGAVWLLQPMIEAYYLAPFLLGIVLLPMIALGDYVSGMSRAQGWAMLSLLPLYILRPVLILVFAVAAFQSGFEASAHNALMAAIAATYATTLGGLALSWRATPKEQKGAPRIVEWRNWAAVSFPIFLVEGFYFTMTNADVLMIGAYLPPEQVAVYFAAVKILALVHFVNFAVRAGAAQRFSTLLHSGDREGLAAFARQSAHWMFWPSLWMAFVIVSVGDHFLTLFGPDFSAGHDLMAVLALGIVARAAVGPCESVLTMTGQEKVCAFAYGIALGVNIALNLLLIPRIGLMGAAVATAIAMLCEAVMLAVIVKRRAGFTMFVLAFGKRS